MLLLSLAQLLLLLVLLVTASSASSSSHHLRSRSVHGSNLVFVREQEDSPCNAADDETSCYATKDIDGQSCLWCRCQAVPSECLSPDQSKNVPPGVFDCTTPSTSSSGSTTSTDAAASKTTTFSTVETDDDKKTTNNDEDQNVEEDEEDSNVYKFSFQQGTYHHLHLNEVHQHHNGNNNKDDAFCDGSSKSMSGYMDISGSKYDSKGEDKHLFYWFFEKRAKSMSGETTTQDNNNNDDAVIPFIVWLTGGPGCSSTLALLIENGPCKVNSDGKTTTVNPYSWTEVAHVLWLDQPAGVGFSYGEETDSNEEMISEDAYYFLQAFFQANPNYVNSPLYIVGESYGGHYAPSIAHRVWRGNQHHQQPKHDTTTSPTIKLNLAGVATGNGLTDPTEQYKWYPEMAYNNSHGIKVIDETTYSTMKAVVPQCVNLIEECNKGDSFINSFSCQTAFVVCNMGLVSPYQMTGLNPYDIRKPCEIPPLCYDMSHITKWLNSPTTRKSLHVNEHSHRWESCNMGINLKFHTDWMKDFSPYVADLLNANISALVYAGDVDFICNYLGNRAWTLALEWQGQKEFIAAPDHDWNHGMGLAKSHGGFTFLQVYDAGHMVPMDQPKVALELIQNFVTGGVF